VNIGLQDLRAILVGTSAAKDHRTGLGIDIRYLRLGGDAIANIYRGEEMEIHLGCQECPQPTQVGEQAGSEQTGYNAVLKLGSAAIYLIGMQGVDIPGGADEQSDIRFSEGASEADFIPQGRGADDSFWEGRTVHGLEALRQ